MSKAKKNKKLSPSDQKPWFELKGLSALTDTQEEVFSEYDNGQNLVLHGYAGTGKTYISLYLALETLLKNETKYDKIIIIRSVVPSRDMGFLPGSVTEKARVYEEPYREIFNNLFGRGDGYEILKQKKLLEFTTTSFLRGITWNNAIVIVDEIQNMQFSEIDTVMTRLGDNSKIIFCGDFRQTDFKRDDEKSGLKKFLKILDRMDNFSHIEFKQEDIVRSGIVRDYIIKKARMEEE